MNTLATSYAADSAPSRVTLQAPTATSLALSWMPSSSASSMNVSYYQVQVSTQASFGDFASQPWSGLFYQVPTTSVVLTGLRQGTVYYSRIRANDSFGNSSNYIFSTPAATTGIAASPGGAFASGLSAPRVYPNPWRKDRHVGAAVTFDQLDLSSTVKLFTIAGNLVKTLQTLTGSATWDLTNDQGDKVASGLYIYLITDTNGTLARGKLSVIR